MARIEQQRTGLSELKEARKVEIVGTAEALFLERGLASITVKDIVEKLGVSRVTFYRYFPDIHPLAMEVAGRMMGQMYAQALHSLGWLVNPPSVKGNPASIEFFVGLIDTYDSITPQLKFMGMFDQYYAQNYPSIELAEFYKKTLKKSYAESSFYDVFPYKDRTPEERDFFVTVGNIVFASLEKIASRGDLLKKEQGISVEAHLVLLKKMLRSFV